MSNYLDIVFDGPPEHEAGRFVEVEDETGASVKAGEWIDRGDGMWALRLLSPLIPPGVPDDDGQVWFDDGAIRVDLSSKHRGPEVYLTGSLDPISTERLEERASELLGAIAVVERELERRRGE